MFAPGIVSTKEHREFSGTFTPDGREYYLFRWTDRPLTMATGWTAKAWTAAERV